MGHRILLLKRTGNSAVVPMWHTCSGFDAAPLVPTQSHQVAGRLQGWAPQEGLASGLPPWIHKTSCAQHVPAPHTRYTLGPPSCAQRPASLPISGQWHHCTLHANDGHPRRAHGAQPCACVLVSTGSLRPAPLTICTHASALQKGQPPVSELLPEAPRCVWGCP